MKSFRRLPLKWQLLLGIQGLVTVGIMIHRVSLIKTSNKRENQQIGKG
jgi:hypothetical protein